MLLSLGAILSSYIGLFLVRSGIVTSVHTFALDPERGLILLFIILFVLIFSLIVYSRSKLTDLSYTYGSILSKEFFFLINNVFLIILAVAILFGTIYPIIYEIFSGGKDISVGKPYFDSVTVPIAFFLAFFQGFGILSNWSSRSTEPKTLYVYFAILILLTISLSALFLNNISVSITVTNLMISSILAGLIYYAFLQIKHSRNVNLSMGFSHFGIAVMILGIGLVSSLESQKELIAFKEKPFELENYKITYLGEEKNIAQNFSSDEVSFRVENLNQEV